MFFLGSAIHVILWLFYKSLRTLKVYLVSFLIASLLALYAILHIDRIESKSTEKDYWLFLPILFLANFGLLRTLFLIIFGNEPLMTGYRQSSWEQGEYRRLHFGDAFFTISTLAIPWLTIIFLSYLKILN
ncbi:hypothetical protein [Chryseobacterium sp. GP-SGM7]|uniref:hypothetical protein n=1 Tax=Chryseobacterium sp. GP-SGM7 TaxID=3411323 RepID=UPI003B92E946